MNDNLKEMLYFDSPATTPIDPRVIEVTCKTMKDNYGNSNSNSHKIGWNALSVLDESRFKIAEFINAKQDEIIFTSGATESNNLAIRGFWEFNHNIKDKMHIITMQTEHKCVLHSCKYLEKFGAEISYLNPNLYGSLDLDLFKNTIKKETKLVSIMLVNNETGVIQNIKKIGEICKEKGLILHVDAAQAFGKIKIDVQDMNIDLMSISGHKIYAPKGIGALFVRKKPQRIKISPIFQGGGQEMGLRSGTQPIPLIAGLAKATEIAKMEMEKDAEKALYFKNKLLNALANTEDVYMNGTLENTIPQILNLSILHIEGESLMMAMPSICVSTGSACNSTSLEPSYVINSMRNDLYYAHSSIRFGFNRFTTEAEVDILIKELIDAIQKMRNISPMWEMKKKGIDFNSIKWDEDHH